ncbi:chemotaxis protein CheW [Mahella australiensis]|uniref:CheW protein n=1 Tax=Mahella australiensis (strain DSM 15567 / CIP 107919 / 50-1 BON) TaxID=697281 RepID=F4A1W2_MAHA5|nr:chemotaxis protein CheW [Mahella australiensis]AEE96078.1 CheW protein [Mahella australiensis 50-1 BON]
MAEQFVIFSIGPENYGLDVTMVSSIERILPITRMPYAEDFVIGVMNLRGDIIPVIDMHRRLGMDEIEDTETSRIIIIQYKDYVVGLKVDAVSNVTYFDTDKIQPFDEISSADRNQYFDRVIYDGADMILIPDISRLLNISED